MDTLIVKGKRKLDGKIVLPAAKNAVLPLLALTVACEDEIVLKDCEPLSDVNKMVERRIFPAATFTFVVKTLCREK